MHVSQVYSIGFVELADMNLNVTNLKKYDLELSVL